MTGESILIVEDDGFIALGIKELLEKNAYRVSATTSRGEDAVKIAEADPPDLILMDIELMGKIDGIETARQIREHADIPIIYLTAYSDNQRISRAKETVPYSYLIKPYNERELLAAVEMALYRQHLDRQLSDSMQRYRAIIDNAAEGILLVSCETGEIAEANPSLIRMLGYSAREIIGSPITAIMAPENAVQTAEVVCSPKGFPVETRFRCRDGSQKEIELTSSIIQKGESRALACLIAHDVTEKKHAETALREAHQKLNLLSGITRHDILNQLTILIGYLEISRPLIAGTALEGYAEKEMTAALAIRRMISFTKEYEEIGQQRPAWQRPAAIIREVAGTLNSTDLTVDCQIRDLEIFADPLLERVFHNLLDNTIRHGKHAKTITITAEPADSGAGDPLGRRRRRGPGCREGEDIRTGIWKKYRARPLPCTGDPEPDRDHDPGERQVWHGSAVRADRAGRDVPVHSPERTDQSRCIRNAEERECIAPRGNDPASHGSFR